MFRTLLRSKIHRATVTQANLHYVGSLTLSSDLMKTADLAPGEKVDVVDIDNGARLSTYVIEGPAGTGTIGINGAAARLVSPGDRVIIIAYGQVDEREVDSVRPRIVFVDENNAVTHVGDDSAHAPDGSDLVSGARAEPAEPATGNG